MSLAAALWSGLRVAPEAKLQTSLLAELRGLTSYGVGQLVGSVLGSCLALVLWTGVLSWVFGKLGASSVLAVGLSCALLCLWSGLGFARADGLQLTAAVQLASYLAASALLFRPLSRWVARMGAKRTGASS
jgi:hypothetical protein